MARREILVPPPAERVIRAAARSLAALSLAAIAACGAAPVRAAANGTPLDRYLDGLETWRATFTQSLADARGRARSSARWRARAATTGSVSLGLHAGRRDRRVRRCMVADGRNLWFLDRRSRAGDR
jgi:outer membrane lipoprotein-sorting protein